jgi:hypothetical protein
MQGEVLLRAAIYLSRLRDSGSRDHAYRLRVAKKLIDLVNAFVADEAKAATEVSKKDPAYLSWEQVGQCLDLSKSAVYARYGKK